MRVLRYTLTADGSSDRALLPIIEWTLANVNELRDIGRVPQFLEPRGGVGRNLLQRLTAAQEKYPCDLLFVHRDAERESSERRIQEIRKAFVGSTTPYVPLVPVRMTEAWMLIDAIAIRTAADNPNGRQVLDLPPLNRLEQLPDPKETLNGLLLQVSGKSGRRAIKFKRELSWRRTRVAELISDFSPLRVLRAFQDFERLTLEAVANLLGTAVGRYESVP